MFAGTKPHQGKHGQAGAGTLLARAALEHSE